MNPIELLMDEHRQIEAVLAALSRWARKVSERSDDPRAELSRFVQFIRGFADRLHHGKEEDLLFVAMVERGFSRDQGPIAVMLAEHEELRELTQTMSKLAEHPQPWGEAERRTVARTALAYVGLLEGHIEKEDQVLYPMAEQQLSSEDMTRLARSFERFESVSENVRARSTLNALREELAAAVSR